MPIDIIFENIPAGYAETASKKGENVTISSFGFFSSEDGDELIQRLEGLPQEIISLIPAKQPILPSVVDSLVAIIRKNKTATVYLNEIRTVAKIRVKRSVEKGEDISASDVLDFGPISFQGLKIPNDTGFIFVFSVGWRKGFFYDLTPLHGDSPTLRDYDLEELLGSLYSYLLFQERFKISEDTWNTLFSQKWFPFAHLDNGILKKIINHAKEQWDIDVILPEVDANVKRLLDEFIPFNKSIPYFSDHIDILEHAIDRYRSGDYLSCASILYPRIEGLMRSFYKLEGYKQKPTPKALSKAVIDHKQNAHLSRSLLLPEKFHYYLDNIYFANFKPGTQPDAGRYSIAHGEARAEDFSLKSSTLGFLILYQLSLFF